MLWSDPRSKPFVSFVCCFTFHSCRDITCIKCSATNVDLCMAIRANGTFIFNFISERYIWHLLPMSLVLRKGTVTTYRYVKRLKFCVTLGSNPGLLVTKQTSYNHLAIDQSHSEKWLQIGWTIIFQWELTVIFNKIVQLIEDYQFACQCKIYMYCPD